MVFSALYFFIENWSHQTSSTTKLYIFLYVLCVVVYCVSLWNVSDYITVFMPFLLLINVFDHTLLIKIKLFGVHLNLCKSCSVIQVKSEIYKVYVWMRIIRENIKIHILLYRSFLDAYHFFGRPHNCIADDICI